MAGAAAEGLYLHLPLSGADRAIPASQVMAVQDWRAPFPLPHAAPWVLGWLPHEGIALPVALPPWGSPSLGERAVLVLLDGGEGRFYLPCPAARFMRGSPAEAGGGTPAILGPTGERAEVLDAVLLYRSFRVGYNPILDG